ncbi:MAG: hypothetical protein JWM56_1261 [Candidatus Peribacteria bacterium]|nr:hypothetical protein [Candidatus Peribacteria bacterium]
MKMLFAAFDSIATADETIDELISRGFDVRDISVITQENQKSAAGNMAAGAAGGATTGGVIGGIAGLLAGAGVFPALAGFLIGGPVAAALGLTGIAAATASGAVTGVVAGGLIGALTNLGLNKADAQYYSDIVENGGVLLGIPVNDDDETLARSILESHGVVRIGEGASRN